MKKIESVQIWFDGGVKNATLLDVSVSGITLGVSAVISFRLYSSFENEAGYPDKLLTNGILNLEGEDYSNWGSDDDYVWIWAANKLNLTLVPNN